MLSCRGPIGAQNLFFPIATIVLSFPVLERGAYESYIVIYGVTGFFFNYTTACSFRFFAPNYALAPLDEPAGGSPREAQGTHVEMESCLEVAHDTVQDPEKGQVNHCTLGPDEVPASAAEGAHVMFSDDPSERTRVGDGGSTGAGVSTPPISAGQGR